MIKDWNMYALDAKFVITDKLPLCCFNGETVCCGL